MYNRRMAGCGLQVSLPIPARVTTRIRVNVYIDKLIQEKFKNLNNWKKAGKEIKKRLKQVDEIEKKDKVAKMKPNISGTTLKINEQYCILKNRLLVQDILYKAT